MSYSKPMNPKRKRRVYATREPPFPVPIATLTNEAASSNQWFYYTGYLHGDHVTVKHSGDIDFLYKMGFFGKGTMSRSKPEFNKRCKRAPLPDSDSGLTLPTRVMSRRSYLRRLNWSSTNGTKDGEYDSSQEILQEDVEENIDKDFQKENKHENMERDIEEGKEVNESALSEDDMEENDWTKTTGGDKSKEKNTMDGWDIDEGNTDFWGEKSTVDSWEKDEGDVDFWNSTETKIQIDREDVQPSVSETCDPSWTEEANDTEISSHDEQYDRVLKDGNSQKASFKEVNDMRYEDPVLKYKLRSENEELCNNGGTNSDTQGNFDSVRSSMPHSLNNSEHCKVGRTNVGEVYEKSIDENEQKEDMINQLCERSATLPNLRDQESACSRLEDKTEKFDDTISDREYDPRSIEEEEGGTLFVVDDSDSESETRKRKFSELPWKPVRKKDPYFMKENLNLTYEEAFFLAYGLGSLVVYGENQEKLLLSSMWKTFCLKRKNFLPKYIAYHYYRSKGWVPKSGLKFGSDFVIYKEGPAFYHSSYSVIIKMVDSETLKACTEFPQRNLDWTRLSGLNRVTEHVAKELLICYVLKPASLSQQDLLLPSCIPQFKVKEHLVSRWVSSQEREHKVEDMP